MSGFDAWYDWAVTTDAGWELVAENARRPARYEKPSTMTVFQDSIGQKPLPRDRRAYSRRCKPFHLSGEAVDEAVLTPWLTRMVDAEHLEKGLEALAGGPTLAPLLRERPSRDAWSTLASIMADEEAADGLLFVPARPLDESDPGNRAVFSTFDQNDTWPEDKKPSPVFWRRVSEEKGPRETEADYAVWQLATEARPKPGQPTKTKTLLCFPCERVGTCRFPVPPDAGWHPRFRAITFHDEHYCGRTFPDGASPDDHAKGVCGENEVTHRNEGIPCAEVYLRSLGETSCVPT